MNTPHRQNAPDAGTRDRKASHDLDDAGYLARFYGEGADTYNQRNRHGYYGPVVITALAAAMQTAYLAKEREAVEILDAGCGTGLVGVQLQSLGFRQLDGFDLFDEMAEKAREIGVYRHVQGNVDLNGSLSEYPNASYDMTICCGVFVQRHVRPHGLRELARVTRPKGMVIVSTRKSYAEAALFEDEVQRLHDAGIVGLRQCLKDARYYDENAHYWVLQIPDTAAAQREEQP
ncbi:SAM-dependent methyltransferase [Mesorhizobium shonense]|uniref:SAM-dependent methyltransferase n=1 Tax=Mesorhizobium shonense TaxID=1209948 RepID=A0ABV2I3U2_9HYPH